MENRWGALSRKNRVSDTFDHRLIHGKGFESAWLSACASKASTTLPPLCPGAVGAGARAWPRPHGQAPPSALDLVSSGRGGAGLRCPNLSLWVPTRAGASADGKTYPAPGLGHGESGKSGRLCNRPPAFVYVSPASLDPTHVYPVPTQPKRGFGLPANPEPLSTSQTGPGELPLQCTCSCVGGRRPGLAFPWEACVRLPDGGAARGCLVLMTLRPRAGQVGGSQAAG